MIVLGVTNSGTGKQWLGPNQEVESEAERLIRIGGVDPLIAGLFARRGANLDNLENFQDPKLRNLMPNPLALKDCDKAAARLLKAIHAKESVAIFGDYDVDGATSSALLIDYFRFFDIEPTLYIPDRLSEGYGPNTPAMETLAAQNSLIICVDCGTLSFEPIDAARAKGADVVVLDHHMSAETLPNAIVVNPNRQDCTNEHGYLSAAAVVFLVMVEMNRHVEGRKPDLLKSLDLVALSTIADVAPLIDANRAFVRSGLERMKLRERVGLSALTERFAANKDISPTDIGFTLAPRLNAGGRVGNSLLATQLLIEPSEIRAHEIVDELDALNSARREIEAEITQNAKAQIEAQRPTQNFVYAAGENWHPGVLGIVASRLKSAFDQPAIVFGMVEGIYHGSARSVEGIDLGTAIARLVSENLIVKGGGHKMAAGLSVSPEMLEPAMTRLDELLKRQAENLPQPHISIDGIISPTLIDLEFLDKIESAGPYGAMAPEPQFALADMKLISTRILKDTHLKYQFQNLSGPKLDILAFGAVGSALELGVKDLHKSFHLAVSFSRNQWNGRTSVSIHLKDWARA